MKIATFNVNSINARLPRILEWFKDAKPDVTVLQEIKCVDEKFPAMEFEELGYNVEVHGQKTYNGVALLSKHPVDDVLRGLPGDDADEQARYIEALVMPDDVEPVRVGGLYLPNGNPAPGPKYDYKLTWMKRLKAHAEALLENEEALILAGDYNVIPQAEDVHDPAAWEGDALYRPETHAAFREILNLGLYDAIRQAEPSSVLYTFWDYQRGAWEKDHGIRIDHLLLSPQAADRFKSAGVDRKERGKEKPSDHVPVWVEIE
ncbi:MAG: exodeoxyribonuclease III [Marinicaulis sp.]|nr:exodeoxyribonuclease III [Marinicaulis sp.]NNE39370.1 exodeoxyribonuclease III [Marinicaulis sp.]NNL88622.1 exodeoxyribonuclease III [Marinicaulis sp.]